MFTKTQNSSVIFLFILLSSIFFVENTINNASGNPLGVNYSSVGGLIPRNQTDLQMIEAEVLMVIDETYGEETSYKFNEFNMTFEGLYTIYNPNVTCEMLVGAPFYGFYSDIESTLEILVDGLEVEFELVHMNFESLSSDWWKYYFTSEGTQGSMYYSYAREFALSNITFVGYSNTTIEYRFSGTSWYNCVNDLEIKYDVATGNAWNGSITETVEFRVIGKQPSRYSKSSDQDGSANLTISDIDDGKSYLWSWIDVNSIYERKVEIFYPMANCSNLLSSSSFLIIFSFLIISSLILKRNKYSKKIPKE